MMMNMIILVVLYTSKYIILITKIKKKSSFRDKSLILNDLSVTRFGLFGSLSGRNK